METAAKATTLHEAIQAFAAQAPVASERTKRLIEGYVGPHFHAKGIVGDFARAQGDAAGTVQELAGQVHRAAYESQVGSPAHRLERLQEFERLESELTAARVVLERAKAEYERAKVDCNLLLTETADTPACA